MSTFGEAAVYKRCKSIVESSKVTIKDYQTKIDDVADEEERDYMRGTLLQLLQQKGNAFAYTAVFYGMYNHRHEQLMLAICEQDTTGYLSWCMKILVTGFCEATVTEEEVAKIKAYCKKYVK